MKTLLLTLLGLIAVLSSSMAEEPRLTIVRLDKNAWIRQGDASAASASEGQSLKKADQLMLLKGNKAVLALKGSKENLLYVEGESTLGFESEGLGQSVHLKEGKIFCFLDKMETASTFSVVTPTAVAVVRGTQFQVFLSGGRTLVFNYNGKVEVHPRKADGLPSEKFLELNAGEKTAFEGTEEIIPPAQPMTQEEFSVVEEVHDYLFGGITVDDAAPAPAASKHEEKKSEPLDVQSHWE